MKGRTKIFFATDVHGSNLCFRKFLNAGEYYGANILIIGGDITGKAIVPITRQKNSSYGAHFEGNDLHFKSEREVAEFEKRVGNFGFYPFRCHPDEAKEISERPDVMAGLFKELIIERIEQWVQLADVRMAPFQFRIFVNPGNDDPEFIDQTLDKSNTMRRPEGKVENIDDYLTMISTGYANETPFQCPRDIPEAELRKRIDDMASKVPDLSRCIFNFHCPPHGTVLDQGPDLDDDLRPRVSGTVFGGKPIGSTAVREAIQEYQPVIGLHGHVHESRGICRIGRTVCLNPGSVFQHGQLRGALLEFEKGVLRNEPLLVEG